MEEEDDPEFWQQSPPSNSTAFMSSIWKDMKKIFKRQIKLRRQLDEQNTRQKHIEESLRIRIRPAPAIRSAQVGREGDISFFPYLLHLHLHDIH